MSQQDVIIFLDNNRTKWFQSKEIAKALKMKHVPIITNLSKLRKAKFVLFRCNLRSNYKNYEYKHKNNIE